MKKFTIVLISTRSMGRFTDNKISNFSNFLTNSISLPGKWEVGLRAISYPSKVFNVTDEIFNWTVWDTNEESGEVGILTDRLAIPKGLYNSVYEVIDAIKVTIFKKVKMASNRT